MLEQSGGSGAKKTGGNTTETTADVRTSCVIVAAACFLNRLMES
jgi:hypothetical protein